MRPARDSGSEARDDVRVGLGHDTHRLDEGRPLILGGIRLDHPRGLVGHSDADVVLHAVADALLGAAALGDIGEHYPDTDPRWLGLDGGRLLAEVVDRVARAGWRPVNCDLIVHAQEPKLGPHKPALRANIARLLGVCPDGRQRQGQDGRACRPDRPRRGDRLRGGRPHRARPRGASRIARSSRRVEVEPAADGPVVSPTAHLDVKVPMPLRVYNTLTQDKEPFQTVQPGRVGMYVCGPTVYSPSHIGHMVGPVIFDTIKRYLAYLGYEVTWVVNITDVDDKLIVQAQKDGTTVKELAERVTADYLACLQCPGGRRHRPHAEGHRAHRRDRRDHPGADRQGVRLPVGGRRLLRRHARTPSTASSAIATPRSCRPGRGSSRRRRSDTRATSRSGRAPSPASRPGRAPGAPAGPAGTSSARP